MEVCAMNKKVFNLFAAAVMLGAVAAGCKSTAVREDLTNPYPEALDDPEGLRASGSEFDVSGSAVAGGQWADPKAFNTNADADGWTPADPTGNNLGMPTIYFAYDSDVLVASERANLDKIAAYLNNHNRLGLVIEGHCDSRGTDEYNRALGERRANAIRAYLAERGVADSRMKTVSYGEDKPAVAGSGDSIWRQNRRGVPVPMNMPRY